MPRLADASANLSLSFGAPDHLGLSYTSDVRRMIVKAHFARLLALLLPLSLFAAGTVHAQQSKRLVAYYLSGDGSNTPPTPRTRFRITSSRISSISAFGRIGMAKAA